MQISVEKREGLQRCMTVELPVEQFEAAVENRLKNIARTVKLDGFRKGKVPMRVVKSRFSGQAKTEALEEAVQSSLYEAMNQENLRPAGQPRIEFQPLEDGKGPTYNAIFEVMPEVEVSDMKAAKIEKPVVEVSDADIDETIERIRSQRQDWKSVGRKSKNGDRLTINFVGKIDGEAFDGGTGNDVKVTLGAGQFIADFEKGLKGSKAGEELVVDATFPEDYGNAELAGKTAQFETTVTAVEEPVLPEVDEDFVKSLGVEAGTVEALREQVRENMERELNQVLREVVKTNVMDALIAEHGIDLPQAMVNDEINNLSNQMRQMMAQQGVPVPDNAPANNEIYRGQAERRVALGLIMSELIAKQELTASPDKVREMVEELAEPYEQPEEVIKYYYSDKKNLANIEAVVLEQSVVDWVLEQAEVVEKPETFKELMASRQG